MKKSNKLKIAYLLVIVISSIAASFVFLPDFAMNRNAENSFNQNEINLSAGEITLLTPEDTTYTNPMAGYYPAVFGFEDNTSGITGSINKFIDIDLSGSGTQLNIISELDSHRRVLELRDSSANEKIDIRHLFNSLPLYGTIEWYWRSTNVDSISYFDITNSGRAKIRIAIWDRYFQYWDGSYHKVKGIVNDRWYHLRLDFECTHRDYKGLRGDTFFLYIDGDKFGPFEFAFPVDNLDGIGISTNGFGTGYTNYIDAIGYSWDPTYRINDNLFEGLLISYTTNYELDWIGYSLDGSADKEIIGDKVISVPEIGTHSIKLSGVTLDGLEVDSDLRYFTSYIEFPSELPENPNSIVTISTCVGFALVGLLGIIIGVIITVIINVIRRKRRSPSHPIAPPIAHPKAILHEKLQMEEKPIIRRDHYKFCPFCGSNINNTFRYCIECGSSLKDI